MFTSSATCSNCSPRFRNASWQPSQELNLWTDTRGFTAMSKTFHAEQLLDFRIGEHRSLPTDEIRTELAVAAMPDRALHVALERKINVVLGNAALGEQASRGLHHDFGSAQHRHGATGKVSFVEHVGHSTDTPWPQRTTVIRG